MPADVAVGRWFGEIRTGRLRPNTIGNQSKIREVIVKTWVNEAGQQLNLPSVGVQIRTTEDESWHSVDQVGTLSISVGEGSKAIVGEGTILSNTIAYLTATGTGPYGVNVSPRKCRIYEDTTLLTGWTSSGFDITLASGKSLGTRLKAFWNGSPQQVGSVGDIVYMESSNRVAIISSIRDHEYAVPEWAPNEYITGAEDCVLIPAKTVEDGDFAAHLACPREVDDLEIRLFAVPSTDGGADILKIKELVVVGFRTGEERSNGAESGDE